MTKLCVKTIRQQIQKHNVTVTHADKGKT